MLKKLLVSAALTMPLSSVMAEKGEIQNINQLRDLCRNLEANEQVKFFDKGLLCKGSNTIWKKRDERSDLPNQGTIFAKTGYDKSASPLSTPGDQMVFESRYNTAECHVYDKFRIVAPQVPVFVNSCDELTAENVERLCREAISDSCFDTCEADEAAKKDDAEQTEGDQAEQTDQAGGACSMKKIGTFNSCDLY